MSSDNFIFCQKNAKKAEKAIRNCEKGVIKMKEVNTKESEMKMVDERDILKFKYVIIISCK